MRNAITELANNNPFLAPIRLTINGAKTSPASRKPAMSLDNRTSHYLIVHSEIDEQNTP